MYWPSAGVELRGWRVFPLPLDNLDAVTFDEAENVEAGLSFAVSEAGPIAFRCVHTWLPQHLQGWRAVASMHLLTLPEETVNATIIEGLN